MKISNREVKINASLGEKSKVIKVCLTKRPSKYRSRVTKTVESSAAVENPTSDYFFNWLDPLDLSYKSGQRVYGADGIIRYDFDEVEVGDDTAEVILTFENPNPALFNTAPPQITFTSKNYQIPQDVTISLKDRTRYCTEYYTDIKIFAESTVDQYYDGLEFYYDISLLVAERRNSFFKCAEKQGDEKYTFPARGFSEKNLKLKKLKIVGCYFNFMYYPVDTITFGDKAYKKADIVEVIAALNGIDPNLLVIPEDYPEFSPVNSNPLDLAYRCIGVDGRTMSSAGTSVYNSSLLASSSPHTLRLVVSDVWSIDIPLSDFTVSGVPNVSSDGLNIGPLSNAVLEYNFEVSGTFPLYEEDFIRKESNGDTSIYYYGVLIGGDSTVEPADIFQTGMTLCRPFQLQLEAEISQNVIEAQADSITHFISLKAESSELKPVYSDYSNEIEIFAHGTSQEGINSTVKVKRKSLDKKHDEILIFEKSCELVWWNKSSENVYGIYEVSTGASYSQIDLFLSNDEAFDSDFLDKTEPEVKALLPSYSFQSSSLALSKINLAVVDSATNQFIIEREIVADSSALAPVIFDLELVKKYGFIIDVL